MRNERKCYLSSIVVNYNGRDFILKALSSLEDELSRLGFPAEVIVVDNASEDDSLSLIGQNFPSARIVALSENTGFARAANTGARASSGQLLFFLNNDIEILPGCIQALVDFIREHQDYGIVAPAVLNPDLSFQPSFGPDLGLFSEFFLKYLAPSWYSFLFRFRGERMERDVSWVSGVAFLIRRDHFFRVSGFDEQFFLYIEDADLGRRIRQLGLRIRFLPQARLVHHRGAAASRLPSLVVPEAKRSQLLYYCRHRRRFTLTLLKLYLLAQFSTKAFLARLAGDKTRHSICCQVIEIVRRFRCAPHS